MRTFFSRFLLVVLAVVAVFAVVRFTNTPRDPDLLVTVGDGIAPEQLRHEAFTVEQPVRLAIHAVGSFETDSTLAAMAWIVRRDSGTLAWKMDGQRVVRGRGTLATVDDTTWFEPGVYDAYFASYGDPQSHPVRDEDRSLIERFGALLSPEGRVWHGDAERWRFQVRFAESYGDRAPAFALRGEDADPEAHALTGEGVVWASGPLGNNEARGFLFEVTAPAPIRVQAVGEMEEGRMRDTGFLMQLGARDTLWTMTPQTARWAGGALKNREVDTTLTLAPGVYRAGYRTNQRHAYERWDANPPFAPALWGLTVTTSDPAHVMPLNAWERLPRIASFTCVGEDELREDTFTLPDTTAVLLAATGEIIGSSEYDYAVLLREPHASASGPQPPIEVWTMTRENTRPAGGADKNREAEAVLTLPPATYTLRYVTDGSHDCSDFNSDEPDHPDRWGATLFALDSNFDLSRVEHADPFVPNHTGSVDMPVAVQGPVLAELIRVGSDEEVEDTFTLNAAATVRIYAIGEIVPSDAYDYAWLTNEHGATIWTMDRDNTQWAGGSKKNRVFDGTLNLAAGTYEIHYRTDGSHAYGDFDQAPPNDPEHWGVMVWRVTGTPAPPSPPDAAGVPAPPPPPPTGQWNEG